MPLIPQFILIIGPMFARKSSELLRRINHWQLLGKKVLTINHKHDQRYGPASEINTHNNQTLEGCIPTDCLLELFDWCEEYAQADVIAIDELQFFSDAVAFVKQAVDEDGKIVIAAGLKGDFNRKPFEQISKLIPHAEKVIELQSLCRRCGDGTEAPFTKKIGNSEETIGGAELYEALCRKHFIAPE